MQILPITIKIDNSFSQIVNLNAQQFKDLRKVLSYTSDPAAAYYSKFGTTTHYLLDKKCFFPAGLTQRVIEHLNNQRLPFTTIDLRFQPKILPALNLFKPGVELYPWQSKALNKALKVNRGGIIAATGSGKSRLIATIAAIRGLDTLVVVPSLEIKKQLKEALVEVLNDTSKITVENIDSIELTKPKHYDCLIIDEAHHVAAKTYQKLNKTMWQGIYYRYFFTATYFRNASNEQLLFEGICGNAIFEMNIKHATTAGYIVPVEAYYYDLPVVETEAYLYAKVYSALVVNNTYRNELIASKLKALAFNGVPTLCLVKEVAHGNTLSELTGVPFVHGQDEDSRKYIKQFNKGHIKALIGTTGVLSEGVDTKPAECIIIATPGKAKSAFIQQVGRGIRVSSGKKSCKVILFRDASHKFVLKHFKEQIKILREEFGVTTTKLEIE